MDQLSSALRDTQAAILTAETEEEKKRLQNKYVRIFAALEARRNNDDLTDEELEDWIEQVYERNEIHD